MVQPNDGYQLRTPHHEKESYKLPWWQSTPIPYQSRNVHDHSWIPSTPSQRRPQSSPGQNSFLLIRKVEFPGHVISEQGIQPVAKRVKDLQNLTSPESKRDVMKVLGCLDFYNSYIKNLHVDSHLFLNWSKILLLLNGRISTKNYLKESKPESPKTLYWQYPQPNTPSTYTSTPLISAPVAY